VWSWRGLDSWKCLIDLLIVYFYWLIWFDWLVQEVNVILITLESWRWLMDGWMDWLIDWLIHNIQTFYKKCSHSLDVRYSKAGHGSNLVAWLGASHLQKKGTLILHSEGQGWKTRNGEDLKLRSTTGPYLWFDLIWFDWLLDWLIDYRK